MAPIPSERMHAIQIINAFDDVYPIMIPFKLNKVTSYFDVRKPTEQDYKDENRFQIELMAEAHCGTHLVLKLANKAKHILLQGLFCQP